MSYDLMVFDVAAAPKDRTAFMKWYDKQTEWTERHSYNDPKVSTPSLRAWFLEMIQEFPALNGPFAGNVENEKITDYSVGKVVIYAAFGWPHAETAYAKVKELAEKHALGFFDASSKEANIWLPATDGKLERLRNKKKPWWRSW